MDQGDNLNVYSKLHAKFLNVMLCEQFMDFTDSIGACQAIWGVEKEWNVEKLEKVVKTINENIRKVLQMEIRVLTCQQTNRLHVLLEDISADNFMRKNSRNDPRGDAYFWIILNAILESPLYELPIVSCLNLTSSMQNPITKARAEILLDEWTEKGYFCQRRNSMFIGVRSTTEFDQYIRQKYADSVMECDLCLTSVLYGKVCPRCDMLFHKKCWDSYVASIKKCPACRNAIQQ